MAFKSLINKKFKPGRKATKTKKMKITEKKLLDEFKGLTNGMMFFSEIEGETIYWVYRSIENGHPCTQTTPERGEVITLEGDRDAEIPTCVKNLSHPTIKKIQRMESRIYGGEI
jgi:hypothetical protein